MTEVPIDAVQMDKALERLAKKLHEYANEYIAEYGTHPQSSRDTVPYRYLTEHAKNAYRHIARRLLEAK